MEKYCCNLELSKKLKNLGVKQESEFYLVLEQSGEEYLIPKKLKTNYNIFLLYSAFTVGELGEMLKGCISGRYAMGDSYFAQNGFPASAKHCYEDKTETNARAEMLIYLIENKLIKVEDL